MRNLILIIIGILSLFLIISCTPNVVPNINISSETNVSVENYTMNNSEGTVFNLSLYININTINLSLGIKLCDYIPEEKAGDKTISQNKKNCILYHSRKDFFMCEILRPQEAREICFLSAIDRTLDPSICETLRDLILKERCKQFILTEERTLFRKISYLNRSDSSICQLDSHFGASQNINCTCPEGYIRILFGNGYVCSPSICDLIYSFQTTKGTFYDSDNLCRNAVYEEKIGYCESLENARERDICIVAYIGRTLDNKACALLDDEKIKESCISFIKNEINN